ncbi:hypothetical protein, partial [Rhodococcus sp. ACPA4]|uniref:hypothetical protein n=1 Tax=Rhodococcus sp. ACPA4 TaxID=2028571 RepID=UPI001C52DD9E
IIRHVKYQIILALTFIDTLLSSQRTRAHHHRNLQATRSGATFPAYPIEVTGANRNIVKKNWG